MTGLWIKSPVTGHSSVVCSTILFSPTQGYKWVLGKLMLESKPLIPGPIMLQKLGSPQEPIGYESQYHTKAPYLFYVFLHVIIS